MPRNGNPLTETTSMVGKVIKYSKRVRRDMLYRSDVEDPDKNKGQERAVPTCLDKTNPI